MAENDPKVYSYLNPPSDISKLLFLSCCSFLFQVPLGLVTPLGPGRTTLGLVGFFGHPDADVFVGAETFFEAKVQYFDIFVSWVLYSYSESCLLLEIHFLWL